jgi:glycerol kinase
MQYLMAIDQGTTSTRVMLFTPAGQVVAKQQLEFAQYYPQDAWVEHDPADLWRTTVECMGAAIDQAGCTAADVAALGISNQRETTLIWDKRTGEPVYNAIVWQDRRTADFCNRLGQDPERLSWLQSKTGLLLDPYFSATKIAWILDNVPGARHRAESGELLFGTVDTFLLWKLTNGQQHATDATNASRTLLYNLATGDWDDELLALFNVPQAILPTIKDTAADFGEVDAEIVGAPIPIRALAGDQQASLVGNGGCQPGMLKSTYGTGCFVLLNTGEKVVQSENRLLSTVAYQIKGRRCYGLEGSIFVAGAAMQWLKDDLRLFDQYSDTPDLAASVGDNGGVYLVPAFTGLGAPYWDASARGALLGLTRNTSIAHVVRAAMEAVCYQTHDLLLAMQQDYRQPFKQIRVDGGMAVNDWLMQFLADICQLPVDRSALIESSAFGAAMLAAIGVGLVDSLADVTKLWQRDRAFTPNMSIVHRDQLCAGWKKSLDRIVSH